MNFKTLFFVFFFGLIGLTTTSFAQEYITQEIDVYQGSFKDLYISTNGGVPQPGNDQNELNTIDFISKNGNVYTYRYTPDPDFLGYDGFTFTVVEGFPFNITTTIYVFQIDVIASMVKTNDDFMHISSQDEVLINPLLNDETSSENLTITLAQILKGSATVNDDNTIAYTPNGTDPDYIIYSVSDEYNTISSSVIYISQEEELSEELTVKDYTIASGNKQYIVLPNEDLTLTVENYDFGSLEEVNSFVYEYTADINVEGSDEINFTDADGNVYQASITIIEKYEDEGYVRDDVFYTASNTSIYLDVKENDLDDQYVIADYSEELLHMGNGLFLYTPPAGYTGVKSFFYTADDGFTEETGSIDVVVNNYKPTTYFEYNLSTPENQPRIIEYDVPLGTEYFEIAALPDYGSIEIFTEEESVDVGCEEGLQKVFAIYTPDADFVGTDNLTIRYCASDNNLCNDVSITLDVVENDLEDCICIDDCVWPGDANGDGKVSILDALSIGRFIGNGGASRVESPYANAYEGSSVDDWIKTQLNGKNLKHADADGDGVITTADLDVVIDNYGEINSVISSDVLGVKNLPFLLTATETEVDSGETFELFVTMGTDAFPAIDIHGISFGLNLNPDLVDSSSLVVEYLESGYLVKDAPYVSMTHQPSDGIVHTAATKSNGVGSTGTGIIAVVTFIVEEDAEGFKDKRRSSAKKIGDIITTIQATDIIIEDSKGFKYALPNTSLDVVVKSGEDEREFEQSALDVFPNPSSDYITISCENGEILKSVSVYSIDGRIVKAIDQIYNREVQIDVNEYEDGLYIIKASGETNIYTTKFTKK